MKTEKSSREHVINWKKAITVIGHSSTNDRANRRFFVQTKRRGEDIEFRVLVWGEISVWKLIKCCYRTWCCSRFSSTAFGRMLTGESISGREFYTEYSHSSALSVRSNLIRQSFSVTNLSGNVPHGGAHILGRTVRAATDGRSQIRSE